jgi:hypothetical protein
MNLVLIAIAALGLLAERMVPDFNGIRTQNNEQCSPKRTGDVTLNIRHRDPELLVETSSKGRATKHALQCYTTDGLESKSTAPMATNFIRRWFGKTAH